MPFYTIILLDNCDNVSEFTPSSGYMHALKKPLTHATVICLRKWSKLRNIVTTI